MRKTLGTEEGHQKRQERIERLKAKRSERRSPTVENVGDAQLVCPHCQTRGSVLTRQVKVKKGISGGKATGAVFTAGLSLVATGLSRKERTTEATCDNCHVTWFI